MIGITASSPRQEATHILAVPTTVSNVGQDRADVMRPGRPLKFNGPPGSYCSRDIGVDCILVADDIGISACDVSLYIASTERWFQRKDTTH